MRIMSSIRNIVIAASVDNCVHVKACYQPMHCLELLQC